MENRTLIWCCPMCARTVKCREWDCWRPNIICTCNYPGSITLMVPVGHNIMGHNEGGEG